MSAKYRLPKGTKDFLPQEAYTVSLLESIARRVFSLYGYSEIRLPLLESTAVFVRSLGKASDIVQKQIFTIASKDDLCLRPEATAQVARCYIENAPLQQRLAKLAYIGPMFRGERPQKGRLRQFHHIGAEAIGQSSALLDAEIIILARDLLSAFGLEGVVLELNSLGCRDDQQRLQGMLKTKLEAKQGLCEECRRRLSSNVLRILDCKKPDCRRIVSGLGIGRSYLCRECDLYFDKVVTALSAASVTYTHVPTLVRGLDYYTQTVFEFTSDALGAQSALGAGGRYDGLIFELGGKATPACGFALGLERILLLREAAQLPGLDVFVAYTAEDLAKDAFEVLKLLRGVGISADMDFNFTSLKSQLRYSQRLKSALAVIIAEDELKEKGVILRDMKASSQDVIKISDLVEAVKSKIERGLGSQIPDPRS
ncbi:histidine--tRNA ligase [Candidatus Omnitrophota bacterium]